MDSTALLHALIHVDGLETGRVVALHVNHGLSGNADEWERHCRAFCLKWGVGFLSARLTVKRGSGRGTEAAARDARYRWLAEQTTPGSVLLAAHHLDDQVETVLAHLFRGGGVPGLSGIRRSRPIGGGRLWRPLLSVPRRSLEEYAGSRGLRWVDDEMNRSCDYTRNHIRHRVLPVIREKWPAVDRVIARGAENWSEARELLDEIADSDLRGVRRRCKDGAHQLHVPDLLAFGRRRRANALRRWWCECGFQAPHRARLARVIDTLIDRRPSPTCLVSWPGTEVRRYRDWLYLSAPRQRTIVPTQPWEREAPAPVIIDGRRLCARPVLGSGIKSIVYAAAAISIGPRRGGERCAVAGGTGRKSLKKIFQEREIPTWRRDAIPLIFVDGQLAGVAGVCYCEPFAARAGEEGVAFELVEDGPDGG